MNDYMAMEQEAWKPMAETWSKDGKLRAWSVMWPVMPGRTELPYQAMSVHVFPTREALFANRGVPEMFKHVHPGSVGKIRELAPREVSVVEQKVTSSSVTSRR